MSGKRVTAASRKRARRARAREHLESRRSGSDAQVFGVSVGRGQHGRTLLKWMIDRDPFLALMGLARLRQYQAELEVQIVAAARTESALSWDEIGWALESTGDAVRKRLGARVAALGPGSAAS